MKKAALIGCGKIARVHCQVIAEAENVRLSALCDVDAEKAAGLKEEYLGKDRDRIQIFTDWNELCENDIDIVHICTPHYLHVPMAVALLDAGKAVFMEKPCAVSTEQYELLKAADERHPGKLGICFQNRYNETTRLTDREIKSGSIGVVTGGRAFVTWRRDKDYYEGSPWKGRIATEGGGALINQSIHTLDLLLRYLGEPVTVRATVSNHHLRGDVEVEDTVEAWMEFKDGKRACFYASNGYVSDAPVILEIQGETGRIMLDASAVLLQNKDGIRLLETENLPGLVKDYWGRGHKSCIEDFYRCLETGDEFGVTLKSTENTFRTMMEIYSYRA